MANQQEIENYIRRMKNGLKLELALLSTGFLALIANIAIYNRCLVDLEASEPAILREMRAELGGVENLRHARAELVEDLAAYRRDNLNDGTTEEFYRAKQRTIEDFTRMISDSTMRIECMAEQIQRDPEIKEFERDIRRTNKRLEVKQTAFYSILGLITFGLYSTRKRQRKVYEEFINS